MKSLFLGAALIALLPVMASARDRGGSHTSVGFSFGVSNYGSSFGLEVGRRDRFSFGLAVNSYPSYRNYYSPVRYEPAYCEPRVQYYSAPVRYYSPPVVYSAPSYCPPVTYYQPPVTYYQPPVTYYQPPVTYYQPASTYCAPPVQYYSAPGSYSSTYYGGGSSYYYSGR